MAQARIIIMMPAHNEADNLPRVMEELRRYQPGCDVVVIDDYSTDATAAVARQWGAQVVSLPCNLGYGGAVQTGFRYAVEHGYDYGVLLDADGQHDPAYIEDLLKPVLAGEVDLAIGSRFLGGAEYKTTWLKRTGQRIFAAIASHFTGRRVTDPTSGFQALNRRVLRFFARDNYPSDYPDADTLMLVGYAGFRVVEVPVAMRERLAGVSMHSSWKIVYYIFKMLLAIAMVLIRQRTHCTARPRDEGPGVASDKADA